MGIRPSRADHAVKIGCSTLSPSRQRKRGYGDESGKMRKDSRIKAVDWEGFPSTAFLLRGGMAVVQIPGRRGARSAKEDAKNSIDDFFFAFFFALLAALRLN